MICPMRRNVAHSKSYRLIFFGKKKRLKRQYLGIQIWKNVEKMLLLMYVEKAMDLYMYEILILISNHAKVGLAIFSRKWEI